ncbi:hypothetical protein PG989_002925 [Apiospora arundinis]
MSPIDWSASPVEMEAAYKNLHGQENSRGRALQERAQTHPSRCAAGQSTHLLADEECIFVIYHTSKDAQATERDQEERSSTGKGAAIRVRLGRPFSELRALWRDFRLARAARREFKGRGETRETRKNHFITFKDKKIPWAAKGTAVSWKLVRTPK